LALLARMDHAHLVMHQRRDVEGAAPIVAGLIYTAISTMLALL
jgi:hypothetical protein